MINLTELMHFISRVFFPHAKKTRQKENYSNNLKNILCSCQKSRNQLHLYIIFSLYFALKFITYFFLKVKLIHIFHSRTISNCIVLSNGLFNACDGRTKQIWPRFPRCKNKKCLIFLILVVCKSGIWYLIFAATLACLFL